MTRWSLLLQTPSSSYTTSWDSTRQRHRDLGIGNDLGKERSRPYESPVGRRELPAKTEVAYSGREAATSLLYKESDLGFVHLCLVITVDVRDYSSDDRKQYQ